MPTHDVFNQAPPYQDLDLFATDAPLRDAVQANGAAGEAEALSAFGRHWGTAEMFEQARLANEHPPRLRTHDPKGFRRDVVEFHPAYHYFMRESMAAGLHAMTWQADGRVAPAPAEVARTARYYLTAQVENGHMCPITMTRAAVAALAVEPALLGRLLPILTSRAYDPAFRPWWEKRGLTIGMGMTEKQGGTDVRANTTRAVLLPGGGAYAITGHKWFMSAPMCDAFLILAQAPHGITCFFLPRHRPDGTVNALHFQRLKDKLGNRSNASSEVEFLEAWAVPVGEEGKGVRTILQMVQLTRLDCAISSAGIMRMALAQALHNARHRDVFKRRLGEQPLMRRVLADLALEVEGAIAMVMRLARAFDLAATRPSEAARARFLTPVVKYAICKTAPAFVYEAMEALGGNAYVEESPLPRLFREAPVNAIWEGPGNVMCLDLLRALVRGGEEGQAVLGELAREAADLPGARDAAALVTRALASGDEAQARSAVDRLGAIAAAAALAGGAPAGVAEAFARTRLGGRAGLTFGTADLSPSSTGELLERALPG